MTNICGERKAYSGRGKCWASVQPQKPQPLNRETWCSFRIGPGGVRNLALVPLQCPVLRGVLPPGKGAPCSGEKILERAASWGLEATGSRSWGGMWTVRSWVNYSPLPGLTASLCTSSEISSSRILRGLFSCSKFIKGMTAGQIRASVALVDL